MNSLVKYGLIAAAIGGFYFYSNFSGDNVDYVEDDIDLNAVLDITVDTLYEYNDSLEATGADNLDPDQTFVEFANMLKDDYNQANPALYDGNISVMPRSDASLLAFDDVNQDDELQDSEPALFMIEIDGEKARIIASSRSGAVNDHHFSGTSLLAGYLIGSMLSRQRAAGVDSKKLSSKQPVTARQAAKARAGSGSHSRGK